MTYEQNHLLSSLRAHAVYPEAARRLVQHPLQHVIDIGGGTGAYSDDGQAVNILKNCRAAMQPHARLALLEVALDGEGEPDLAR